MKKITTLTIDRGVEIVVSRTLTDKQTEAIETHNKSIQLLIDSCEEGIDGRWDCTPDGFRDMIGLLEDCFIGSKTSETIQVNTKSIDTGGTHLQGYITISYQALVDKLGESEGPGDKTLAEWSIAGKVNGKKVVATIYDYKNYGMKVEKVTDWHIGGFDNQAVELIKQIFPGADIKADKW